MTPQSSECYNLSMRLWQHPNGYWYAEFETDKRRSLKTKDADLAKRLFTQLKRDYLKGKLLFLENGRTISLQAFKDELLNFIKTNREETTYNVYRVAFTRLLEHIGDIDLKCITRQYLEKFHNLLLERGAKKVSVNTYMRHLKAGLQKAVEWEYLNRNPYTGIKQFRVDKKLPRFLSQEEIVKLLNSIKDKEYRIMVELYLYTGLRRSELLRLSWTDIDVAHGFIYLRKTKTHLERAIPLTEILTRLIEDLRNISGRREYLFRWKDKDVISRLFRRAIKKAGVKKARLHDLRHTFASHLVMSGEELRTVQELLGHQQISTTLIYAHLSKEYLKNALSKFRPPELGKTILDG
ncbi:MAG: tyrosine-type recombinase/integrase [Nitrospirae bacterium]|nr:tyrosine-type recombinase/integrase [Nitrospirota bacterium]